MKKIIKKFPTNNSNISVEIHLDVDCVNDCFGRDCSGNASEICGAIRWVSDKDFEDSSIISRNPDCLNIKCIRDSKEIASVDVKWNVFEKIKHKLNACKVLEE